MTDKLNIAVTGWTLNGRNTAKLLAEQAQVAEQLGFHSFWLPESHFSGDAAIPSPLMLLAAIASQTSRLKLGSTSYLLPIRHPLQAAEEVAVLDSLSEGRLILGIGRGFQPAMFSAFEIPLKEKRKRFSEVLDTMVSAWSGEPVAWTTAEDGSTAPVLLAPLPIQKPHPPIWVAAFGPLALRQAGSLGLPYLASPVETRTALLTNYKQHAGHAQAAGHPPIDTVPVMRILFVSKDRKRLKKVTELIEQQAFGQARRNPGATLEDWAIIGTPDEVAESIAAYRSTLGITHLIASGRISGIDTGDYVNSLETLAELNGH